MGTMGRAGHGGPAPQGWPHSILTNRWPHAWLSQTNGFILKKLLFTPVLFFSLACRNGATSQPTATPTASVAWNGEDTLQAGSVTIPCGGLGGIAASPATSSWLYTEAQNVCMLHSLPIYKSKPKDIALGPIDDCGLISEVGDVTAFPAGANSPDFFYVVGSLSVKKKIDESGSVSFDSGTANLLFQIDATQRMLPTSIDTTNNLRSVILEDLRRWNTELEEKGLQIERDKKPLVLGGLAATPGGDFLFALKAPLVCPIADHKTSECRAIVLLVSDLAELFEKNEKEPPKPEIKAHAMLTLDGEGAASIEYEPLSEGFLLNTASKAYLLRYQPGLTSIFTHPISVSSTGKLRALVPAPGGAAALFTQDADNCPASRLTWLPVPIDQLDGIDRSTPPE
jgi:hypothetical protein